MGWQYLGISDHSKSAGYANGLDDARLRKQCEEIDALNAELEDFRIFKGIESDILKDGSLDYSERTLSHLDFVIASIHQRFGIKDMTDRLITAIENPYTTMIGHISGRLLLSREEYDFDHKKVIQAAIKNKVVIELNANPHRLDLDWRDLAWAGREGLLISINPDAHSADGFHDVHYGIWMARKAMFPKDQIVNTWPLKKIESFLKERKK